MFPALLAASLAAQGPPAAKGADIPAEVEKIVYATTRVSNLGNDFRVASGVTIGVRDGFAYVLTANHALGQDGDRRVDFFKSGPDGPEEDNDFQTKPAAISVEMRSAVADLAILKVLLPRDKKDKDGNDLKPPFARLAPPLDRPKRFPSDVYSVGCSQAKDAEKQPPTVTVTTLIARRLKRTGSEPAIFWETNSSHEAGRSGGPLVDRDGRVIGICAANDTATNHGFFAHLDEIQAWMKKNGAGWMYEDKR